MFWSLPGSGRGILFWPSEDMRKSRGWELACVLRHQTWLTSGIDRRCWASLRRADIAQQLLEQLLQTVGFTSFPNPGATAVLETPNINCPNPNWPQSFSNDEFSFSSSLSFGELLPLSRTFADACETATIWFSSTIQCISKPCVWTSIIDKILCSSHIKICAFFLMLEFICCILWLLIYRGNQE